MDRYYQGSKWTVSNWQVSYLQEDYEAGIVNDE